jgi:LysR family transcriptional activator of nhaA
LEKWFQANGIVPRIVGEFDDAAMGTVVASDGLGFMPMPRAVNREAWTRYHLDSIGNTEECQDQFYAITAERRLTHPAVLLVTQNAQSRLFSSRPTA